VCVCVFVHVSVSVCACLYVTVCMRMLREFSVGINIGICATVTLISCTTDICGAHSSIGNIKSGLQDILIDQDAYL